MIIVAQPSEFTKTHWIVNLKLVIYIYDKRTKTKKPAKCALDQIKRSRPCQLRAHLKDVDPLTISRKQTGWLGHCSS